ncbi:hypothetical protein [Desulfobacter postgatei]|uniref:Tetratricopeptide repeat protein n=1 Tax=Desulfobacter postgatei 2ac9 TaxID=879212 RepID=I5B5V5_9BACT|nr:hypothetical protein [Desulfobacter postgatei]EIM64868.1 hypothetical protein DespoDRAFT_03059 [Desulfobacter postgatei 2ac9]
MGVFANIFNWLRDKTRPQGYSPPYVKAENSETWETCSEESSSEVMLAAYYDKNLFERARTQWQFGDWESLARIERESLNHHPQRTSLALLAAAGHQQQGNTEATREFTRLAKEWGASRKMISQVLIAGVYNTLGKASALCGQQQRAIGHFQESLRIAGDGGDVKLLTQARASWQAEGFQFPGRGSGNSLLTISTSEQPPTDAAAHQTPSDKYAALALIHALLKPALYLEIGVGQGKSLALPACPAVGVDPVPRQLDHLPDTARVVTATSDEFFADMAKHILPHTPDLILLDGMPLLEYLLRDFIHAEALAHSKTLIMVPGVLPPDPAQATRRRTGQDWTGDIWKFPEILQTHRPDLRRLLLDVTPSGLLLITGLDPASTILSDKTPEILSNYQSVEVVPEKVTTRSDAVAPDQRVIREFVLGCRF